MIEAEDMDKLNKVREQINQYFLNDPDDAYQKLFRFVTSDNKRVAWVIFSRTFQKIPYDDRDPLDDYTPRVSEVLTITSTFIGVK